MEFYCPDDNGCSASLDLGYPHFKVLLNSVRSTFSFDTLTRN